MKKFYLSIAAVAALSLGLASCTQNQNQTAGEPADNAASAKGEIVYVNVDKILADYDMANDLRSVVETKVNSISQEINRRGTKLQNDVNAYQDKINKGLLTRSVAEQQALKLQQQEEEFNQYAAQKQQEMAEEQSVMVNQITNAIKEYIDKFNEQKGYAMIIGTQGEILPMPVITADPALDITDEILKGLNDEYIKTKSNK